MGARMVSWLGKQGTTTVGGSSLDALESLGGGKWKAEV